LAPNEHGAIIALISTGMYHLSWTICREERRKIMLNDLILNFPNVDAPGCKFMDVSEICMLNTLFASSSSCTSSTSEKYEYEYSIQNAD
jgi:hypothetical protein